MSMLIQNETDETNVKRFAQNLKNERLCGYPATQVLGTNENNDE